MTVLLLGMWLTSAAGLPGSPAQNPAPTVSGPETIHVIAAASPKGTTAGGQVTVPMVLKIDRYTPEHARVSMTDALQYRGYPGFLLALRDSPVAGSLEVAGQKFVVRWAHQEPTGNRRTITIVTDKPVYFVGLGRPDAKPTAGYEVAVLKLELDASGAGEGVMAAAARVKRSGTGGVQIDDYAETPFKLTAVPPSAR